MSINVGDTLPAGTFKTMGESGPVEVSVEQVFKGKKVVLFAVPGAFTPTCSRQHLPSYVKNHDAIRAKGFDAIACLAVNDVFVMDEWSRAQGAAGKVMMLADGNADYARALGLEADFSKFGMGVRAKRFSMVVENGVVRQLSVEAPGAYDLSGAEKTCSL